MSSPVLIPFKSFIHLDKDSETALYLQLVNQMINAIQRGYLARGTKLPGTRKLSQLLHIHRNTVVAAYEELELQDWIEIQPNKGSFVLSASEEKPQKIKNQNLNFLLNYPSKTSFKFKQSNILDNPYEDAQHRFKFNDGIPDARLSQISQLAKWYSASLKRKKNKDYPEKFQEGIRNFFRNNLSNYLNLTRGLHISKENILVTRSIEMSLFVAAETLISLGDKIIVGDPSYFAANMTFQRAGAEIFTVPTDEKGVVIEAVRNLCKKKKIRLIYLTPHHHYPTTATLSAERRIELLELSKEYDFIILEDDYDYDFQYQNSQVLPLASADNHGNVVYIGSFGRSLAPGFRAGFVVAPQNLIMEMNKLLGIIDRQGDIFAEQVLGEMIEEGEIHKHLKKTISIYRERRNRFADLLEEHLSDWVKFKKPSGGLAIWTEWNPSINLMKLRESCMKQNIFIPKSLMYQNKKITAMRLGFGSFDLEEMELIVNELRKVLK